jgi:T3SS negative regulator,GrlR
MLDGFWTIEFGSNSGLAGAGVLCCAEGKILGGDAGYYYYGQYRCDGAAFEADLTVVPFIPNYVSVFGTQGQSVTLHLTGNVNGDNALAQGQPSTMPQYSFGAKLIKRFPPETVT